MQPSVECSSAISQVCGSAGKRLVVMVNPQYRESDDTLDYISKSGGFFSSVAGFLGGKAKFVKMLDEELGFVDTFSLQSFVVRGSEVGLGLGLGLGSQRVAIRVTTPNPTDPSQHQPGQACGL